MKTTLAAYVTSLKGDQSFRDIAASGVSRSAFHQIVNGTTPTPTPESLALLARYFGSSDFERAEIYGTMMALAGYFDPLFPAAYQVAADERFDELADAWIEAIEASARSTHEKQFARQMRRLKSHDPIQFALHYNAAMILARLRDDAVSDGAE